MRVYALSDLHLSLARPKPMDIFGPAWKDHPAKIEAAWREVVGPGDWVLLAGDLSWAMKLEEVEPDLAFLESLPGKKVLLKGNHAHWWTSRAKVERILPPSVQILQNDALALGEGWVVAGTRGWNFPGAPGFSEQDGKILAREVGRLRLSLEAAERLGGRDLVVMTHFPPLLQEGKESPLLPLILEAGARFCLYGHLHGKDHALGFQGVWKKTRFLLTSADALDFRPLLVLDTERGGAEEERRTKEWETKKTWRN